MLSFEIPASITWTTPKPKPPIQIKDSSVIDVDQPAYHELCDSFLQKHVKTDLSTPLDCPYLQLRRSPITKLAYLFRHYRVADQVTVQVCLTACYSDSGQILEDFEEKHLTLCFGPPEAETSAEAAHALASKIRAHFLANYALHSSAPVWVRLGPGTLYRFDDND